MSGAKNKNFPAFLIFFDFLKLRGATVREKLAIKATHEEGMQKGIEKGKIEGIEKGKEETQKYILNLMAQGLSYKKKIEKTSEKASFSTDSVYYILLVIMNSFDQICQRIHETGT